MTFPQTPLPLEIAFQLGSVWTDVTSDVRAAQQVRIQRGRSDEGQQVDTTRCQFVLDNNSGKYSLRNPASPYFGQIGRNTPCRVSVMTGTPYLDLPGGVNDYAETPDTAALDITGDLDIRLDASWSNWLAPLDSTVIDTVEMMGKFNGSQKSWLLGSRQGRLYFEWSADGTTSFNASSTLPPAIPGAGGRLAVRATLDVNNGSGGWTVKFYTADTLDSPWVQLGDAVSGPGVTSIFNSTAPLRIGQATSFLFRLPVGKVHSAEIRNGLWGTVVAQPYFSNQAVGTTSFADSAGRTWTLNGDASITNRRVRFVGEVSAWSVRWESKHDVVTQVDASGVMRRLTQGASPVRSAMYRELTNPSRTSIVTYLPMEDEASATTFASGLNGQPAMPVPPAGVTLASYSDWAASAPLPVFTFGTAKVRIAPYSATNAIFLRFFAAVPAGGVTGTDRLLSFTTTGTARTWSLFVNAAGSLDLRAYDADGTQLLSTGFVVFQVNGVPRHIGIELTQVGADISWKLIVFKIDETRLSGTVSSSSSGTLTGQTAGAATEARIGQDGLLNGTAVGHVAFSNSTAGFAGTAGAMVAWREETTSSRINRLGLEEGIPAYSASVSDQQMGTQGTATLMDLFREAEAADEGILCEERGFLGLRFRDHASLYNQVPALTLNYTGNDGLVTPLEPTDDDQQSRNDITAARTGGSSTRLTLDTGALSTQAPPNGIGRYPDSVTRNLASDAQTGDHAGWLLHLATWDETRYPVVRMMLSKAPGLIEAAAAVDIGDRIRITNPPSWLPPDDIGLMVQGYTETLDQFTWNLDFNCTPAGPWDVAWAGDRTTASSPREFAWVDTDGSALAEDLTTTETDVDILTTAGPRWTGDVADMPFDVRVGGEVMTVTVPSTVINPNAFFDTDVNGWTSENATLARSTTYVHPHPRALASQRITPTGGAGFVGTMSDMTPVGSITPGATYVVSFWAFNVNGWSDIRASVSWYTSGGAFISTDTSTAMPISASLWTYFEATFTAPATASRARSRARYNSTPTASDVLYVWAVRVTRKRASWLFDDFGRTATGGWGTSDSGMAWNTVGGGPASDYAVGSGYATQVLSTVDTSRRTAVTAANAAFDIYCDITTSALATGDSLYGAVTARMLDASNMYVCRLEFTTGNAVILSIRKVLADVQTSLGSFTLPFAHTAGTFTRVRFQGSGTTLRAKAWRAGDQEPDTWHVDTTDGAITAANQIGTRSIRVTGNTNTAAVEIRYDNFEVVNPQTFTVARSQNRVVKSHSAGADVRLAYPAYTAL